MEAIEDVLKVSGQCVCMRIQVCVCVSVPSSCIMTCSETTHSRSHLPLKAHNCHAGVIMHPVEESVLQHKERVAVCRTQTLDAPKWPHSLSRAEPPLISFLGAVMVLIKGARNNRKKNAFNIIVYLKSQTRNLTLAV